MKLVMLLVVRNDDDVLDEHLAYHLNAGVDLVIAADHDSNDSSGEILDSYAREGYVHKRSERVPGDETALRRRMARLAASEHGATWLIDSEVDEFWLPRAESLKEVLRAIPERYGVVQALVRLFPPRPDDGRSFVERMTIREASDSRDDEPIDRLERTLRPVFRARLDPPVGSDRETALDGRVPLRAWYPIEVLRFPLRSREQAERRAAGLAGPRDSRSPIEHDLLANAPEIVQRWNGLVLSDAAVASGVADGTLIVDERLRDALHRLETVADAQSGAAGRFALPRDGADHLGLRPPTVIDDVAYAAECAAVREVDFEPLRLRIVELESRIARLESRLWPRIRRRLARLLRR